MSLYLVRPKVSAPERIVALMSRRLDAGSRKEQLDEVQSLRMADPVKQDIRKWVADTKAAKVSLITQRESDTPVTGVTVLDMPDEEAERMRREMPDVVVLRDRPIDLIRPVRATAAAKTRLTGADLWHLRAIGLEAARKARFKGTGAGITVAVLDTGIDPTPAELEGRVAGAYTFDVNAWEAQSMDPSRDTDGHGTHVAGLICGKRVGVAPGARVLNGVMIPQGQGNLSDFILAMEWAARQPEVQIVNMSAGIPGYLPEMHEAVGGLMSVGVLPVFATGNEGRNQTRSPGNYIEALSVGASNSKNRVASFSSGGRLTSSDSHVYVVPDLVAPGEAVYSCVMGGGYEAWDGTSMATPIVSGIAALILEKYADITVPDLVEELLLTCKDLKMDVDRQGKGVVQVKGAL